MARSSKQTKRLGIGDYYRPSRYGPPYDPVTWEARLLFFEVLRDERREDFEHLRDRVLPLYIDYLKSCKRTPTGTEKGPFWLEPGPNSDTSLERLGNALRSWMRERHLDYEWAMHCLFQILAHWHALPDSAAELSLQEAADIAVTTGAAATHVSGHAFSVIQGLGYLHQRKDCPEAEAFRIEIEPWNPMFHTWKDFERAAQDVFTASLAAYRQQVAQALKQAGYEPVPEPRTLARHLKWLVESLVNKADVAKIADWEHERSDVSKEPISSDAIRKGINNAALIIGLDHKV